MILKDLDGERMMEYYTKKLAEFACDLRFEDISSDVIIHLKLCVLDIFGCGIFGSTTQWGERIQGGREEGIKAF